MGLGWSMPNTSGDEAYVSMEPDTLTYAYLWIDVPAVIDGAPLAETGPRFTLSAVSGLDKAVTTWNFELLMNQKKNVTIDAIEASIQVAPNQDGRVTAVVPTLETPTPSTSPCRPSHPRLPLLVLKPLNSTAVGSGPFGGLEDVILNNESGHQLGSNHQIIG